MKNNIEIHGAIYKTYDYDIFKIINENREINDSNCAKLVKSFEQGQLIIPILVNEKYEVVDGQHRLYVCKKLQQPVYYHIEEGYGKDELVRAQTSADWTSTDYLHRYITEGKEDYKWLNIFLEKYNIGISGFYKLHKKLEENILSENHARRLFKDGTLTISSKEKNALQNFGNALQDFNNFEGVNNTYFINAFLNLYFSECYQHNIMKKKLKLELPNKKGTKIEYINELIRIYNKKTKEEDKLFYVKAKDKIVRVGDI